MKVFVFFNVGVLSWDPHRGFMQFLPPIIVQMQVILGNTPLHTKWIVNSKCHLKVDFPVRFLGSHYHGIWL